MGSVFGGLGAGLGFGGSQGNEPLWDWAAQGQNQSVRDHTGLTEPLDLNPKPYKTLSPITPITPITLTITPKPYNLKSYNPYNPNDYS